jgi:hypothetical protein
MTFQWMRDASLTGDMFGPRVLSAVRDIHESYLISDGELQEMLCRMHREFGGTQTYKEYLGGNRIWRQRLIMAASRCGLMPTGHNSGEWQQDLSLAFDGYSTMEHWFPAEMHDDAVQLVAKSGMIATPTWIAFHNFYPGYSIDKDRKIARFSTEAVQKRFNVAGDPVHIYYAKYRARAKDAVKVLRAGGRVSMGGHGVIHGMNVLREIWIMSDAGASSYEALQTATIHAAHAIGLEHQIGSLEVGKLADLQVLDGNPLIDIKNINTHRYTMKNGRLYDSNTLAELWPLERPAPVRWWETSKQTEPEAVASPEVDTPGLVH